MKFFSARLTSQRGEITSILSVVSLLVIGVGFVAGLASTQQSPLSRSSRAEGIQIEEKYKGLPIGRSDGQFIATGRTCGAHFTTQIDPYIKDIIITRPPTKNWPAGQESFSLVEDGKLSDIVDLVYTKNYQIVVRFDPADPDKKTPNPNDLLVTYKVPSQADKTFVVDQSLLPDWIRTEDTEVLLVFTYTRKALAYRFSSATSKKCAESVPTVTPTVTPTPGMCYDACTTDAQCGNHVDPATGKDAKMICLKKDRTPGGVQTNTTFLGFTIQNEGDQTEKWPYKSVAMVKDMDKGGEVMDYVEGLKWENEIIKNGVFKDANNKARIVWETDFVPTNLRREYSITLSGLPENLVIKKIFCKNTDPKKPDGCVGFETNNPNKTSATIKDIVVTKDASIEYGWEVGMKLTTNPTEVPVTLIPITPKPEPQPNVCVQIQGKVPPAVISACTANPKECPGWNPSSKSTFLTLNDINKPFNQLSNPLVFKTKCEDPTPEPTEEPTETPEPTEEPTVTPEPTQQPTPGGHAPCDPSTGEECKCMPPSCTGRDCSTKKLACEKPDEPCKGGICRSCTYDAITFVEECTKINPITGNCENIPGSSRLEATPIVQAELDKNDPFWKMWAPMNNKQATNDKRPLSQKPADADKFAYEKVGPIRDITPLINLFTEFDWGRNKTAGISMSPAQNSKQDVIVKKLQELLSPSLGIKMPSVKELQNAREDVRAIAIPNEQYSNMENATVKLFYNQELYRIVPNGRNIYSCINTNAAEIVDEMRKEGASEAEIDKVAKMQTGTGACDMTEFNANTKREEIAGLTVGCGQRIAYGWTLQKCTFDYDYIFVVDTSSSMVQLDKNVGARKIDAVVAELGRFVDNIASNGTDSRVAIINFNNAAHIYDDYKKGTFKPEALSADGTHMGLQTKGLLSMKDPNSLQMVKDLLPRFKKYSPRIKDQENAPDGLMERGTCIECGLDLANHVARNRTEEEMRARPAIVIFMTDGIPNSYSGLPTDPDLIRTYPKELWREGPDGPIVDNTVPLGWQKIYTSADELRNDGITTKDLGGEANSQRIPGPDENPFDTVRLITIGYGDAGLNTKDGTEQRFERMINAVASDRGDGKRWSFSTDPVKESALNIDEVFAQIQKEVNTCSMMQLAFDVSQRARDINKDGIINTVDLFMIYENYLKTGNDLPYDIDGNSIVNALDVSLVLNSLGTVITDDTQADSSNEIDQVNSRNVQSN